MSAKRLRPKLVGFMMFLILLTTFYGFHCFYMWHNALMLSGDSSSALSVRAKTAEWLSGRLEQSEIALVSFPDVYRVVNPNLDDKLIEYRSLWDSAGVTIGQREIAEEVLKVRSYFLGFLKENPQVRYVVRDWGDPYSEYVYGLADTDELMVLLREVEVFPFTLSTGWSSQITVYERVEYASLFSVDFSVPPKQFSVSPGDVVVLYGSEGAAIDKVGSRVGFYLPLEEGGINASRLNYVALQFRSDVEDLELQLVFYYDENRDGKWSGYDIDYVRSPSFNLTRLGCAAGEWHTVYQLIPQADDPVVQIGIIMTGDKNGTITLKNLTAYTEKTFEN